MNAGSQRLAFPLCSNSLLLLLLLLAVSTPPNKKRRTTPQRRLLSKGRAVAGVLVKFATAAFASAELYSCNHACQNADETQERDKRVGLQTGVVVGCVACYPMNVEEEKGVVVAPQPPIALQGRQDAIQSDRTLFVVVAT